MVADARLKREEKEKKEVERQRTEKQRPMAFVRARIGHLLVVVVIVEPDEENGRLKECGEKAD